MGTGENVISHREGAHEVSLALSLSNVEPSTILFFHTLLSQQGIFLTLYLHALLGEDFLDIIPKLCPCSAKLSAVYVRQNCQTIPNSVLAARHIGQRILGSSAI